MMSNPETAYEVLKNAMLRTHLEAEKGMLSIHYIPMNEVVLLENAVIIDHRGNDENSSNQ
jgi:Zn-dependent membrane protease YugP